MVAPVYLDTARMGKISPTALAIQTDYLRFAAERSSSEATQDLLVRGGVNWPDRLQRRYPVLSGWCGVGPLKRRLRRIVGTDEQSRVLLASRSHALMLLASHLLFRNCETVMTVDLGWPGYHDILQRVAGQLGRRVIEVRLRDQAHRGGVDGMVHAVAEAFRRSRATGLFLPAISHDGVRLPVREIGHAVKASNELRFFAVDGAQHLAHGDSPQAEMECDFYLAGTHKWLRSHYPLGVAFFGRRRSQAMIETAIGQLTAVGVLDDPLLRFTAQLESGELDGHTETVNLSALLSAHGAAEDAQPLRLRGKTLAIQLKNADTVSSLAADAGWRPVRPTSALRSGILLLRPPARLAGEFGDNSTRAKLRGVVATTYESGLTRFSMPRRLLGASSLNILRRALLRSSESTRLRRHPASG